MNRVGDSPLHSPGSWRWLRQARGSPDAGAPWRLLPPRWTVLWGSVTALLAGTSAALCADRNAGIPPFRHIRIQLAAQAVERLKDTPREYVPGEVTVDGKRTAGVRIRLKGHGSFRPITEKPNFAVKFPGHRRRRLLLDNSSQDPSFVRWKLASEMFLEEGLPVAGVGFARVELNGRDLGLYLAVEPTDASFLRQHFGSSAGALYEGSNQDVDEPLEKDSGGAAHSQADLQRLAAACVEPDLEKRWDHLNACLDVDRFVAFAAMEALIDHHDGYSLDRNNFRIYHAPASDRLVFIPHGMDLIFGNPTAPLEGRWQGLVARTLFETPKGRARYRRTLTRLATRFFTGDTLVRRLDTLSRAAREAARPGAMPEGWDLAVADLRQVLRERCVFVAREVSVVP